MERPEKKEIIKSTSSYQDDYLDGLDEGHNLACDKWEKYCEYLLTKIPSDEAIKKCPAPAYAYGFYQGQFDLLMDLIHPKE